MERAAEKLPSVVGLLYALKTQPAHQEYKPLIPCFVNFSCGLNLFNINVLECKCFIT